MQTNPVVEQNKNR